MSAFCIKTLKYQKPWETKVWNYAHQPLWEREHNSEKTSNDKLVDWLLYNVKWTHVQLYHGEDKLHFDERVSTLY